MLAASDDPPDCSCHHARHMRPARRSVNAVERWEVARIVKALEDWETKQ
jgi:hypothetical protein